MKIFFKFLICVCFILVLSNRAQTNDLDQDHRVTINDAIIALKVSSGMEPGLICSYGLTWKGDWKENEIYKNNEIVHYKGSSYICIQEHESTLNRIPSSPALLGLVWEVFALGSSLENLDLSNKSVTELKDVTSVGSGAIITTPERQKLSNLSTVAITGNYNDLISKPDSLGNDISWNKILNIPSDFADGVDNIGLTTESDPSVPSFLKNGVSWDEISDKPSLLSSPYTGDLQIKNGKIDITNSDDETSTSISNGIINISEKNLNGTVNQEVIIDNDEIIIKEADSSYCNLDATELRLRYDSNDRVNLKTRERSSELFLRNASMGDSKLNYASILSQKS